MKLDVHPDDVDTYNTDDRGRIYLGSEFANSEVEVAIVGTVDDD